MSSSYSAERPQARGPLRKSAANPRYFEDDTGRVVYLTGSHTWSNFKDLGVDTSPPPSFDFDAYLNQLESWNHNFIRLWTWELSKYQYSQDHVLYAEPFPWSRTGPGVALDGKPKFDLTRFDRAYFDRLRTRVKAAGEKGMYVSIMLFEGHGMVYSLPPWCWDGHPFNAKNNVNGINGDLDNDGKGIETHTLAVPAVTAIQEAYVRKVIDTVNELDNVLYEIANESSRDSTAWQYHIIRFIKEYEATKPKRHPVGMTSHGGGPVQRDVLQSPADWVSPSGDWADYRDNPPPADGSKVILSDTDHLWGIGGDLRWVWKTFLRGMQPLYMDPFDTQGFRSSESVRRNLGYPLAYANRVDLAHMTPQSVLTSSGYCLANPVADDAAYLVYLPEGGTASVDLSGAKGRLAVEWFNSATGTATDGGTTTGGASREFRAPFDGDAVLFIRSRPR